MSPLDAALALAANGMPVFPCLASKAPACAGGFKSATTDPARIRTLFANPAAELVGIPTGAASGLDVLDLDPRNGSAAWTAAHGGLIPPTLIHSTRSGGEHILFRHKPGLGCSAGGHGVGHRPGVDIKADGGYIVHWPSTGLPMWMDEDPAPWPAALLGQLAARPSTAAAPTRDLSALAPPFASAAVDVLNRLPNPIMAGRDLYARVMLAAVGCVQGLGDDPDGAIEDAAVAWAERWEGGSECDERAKWHDDWSHRTDAKAGWNTLLSVAHSLIPGFRDPTAGLEFAVDSPPPVPPLSEPAPGRRRIITPSQCDGIGTRPYVVKGLLAARDVGCLFGPPGAGKSLIGPLLAYCIARGEPFFGLRSHQGTALYVAAEDEAGMERRVSALRTDRGDAPRFGLVKGVSDLLDPAGGDLAWLRSVIAERRPSLIVIDTLALAFPGLIENDAEGMGRVVAVARKLTEHGAAVLIIHHDTKARDGTPRGHSLFNAALDVALALDPKDADGIVRGRLTKNRNGPCEHEFAFRIGVRTLGIDADGDPITAALALELAMNEADAPISPRDLSAGQRAALAALETCLMSDGVRASDGAMALPEAVWTNACMGLSGAETPRDRARAARGLRAKLVARGLVRCIDGMFAPTRPLSFGAAERIGMGSDQGIEFIDGITGDQCGIASDQATWDRGSVGSHPFRSDPLIPPATSAAS